MNRRSYPRGLSVFVSEEMDDTIRAIHARDGGGLSDVIRDLLDEALEARAREVREAGDALYPLG